MYIMKRHCQSLDFNYEGKRQSLVDALTSNEDEVRINTNDKIDPPNQMFVYLFNDIQ
jgi:hypothetical protein